MLYLKDKTLAFPSVAVVGMGGAGCNMVQCDQRCMAYRPRTQYLAVDTDHSAITRIQGIPPILLSADVSGIEAVMPWLVQCKVLYLLAGLGGQTGSTATPALARLARDAGLHTVALVGMPLHWEGAKRHTSAERALKSVQEYAAETVVVHSDAVAELLGEDVSVESFFEEIDGRLLRELAARAEKRD